MLTIRHTHQDGTVLDGSTAGDGAYEILQPMGWTYRSWAGVHIRGTRDRFVFPSHLERYAAPLRAAGHAVAVTVDNTWRPATVRWAERAERADDRAERTDDRAGRAATRSTAARQSRQAISDGIPAGQPKLADHHSYPRACRDEARINLLDQRAYEEADRADHLAARADGVRANEHAKHNPTAIMRKIDELETAVRRNERALADTAAGEWADVTRLIIDRDQEEITYLRGLLHQHAHAGTFVAWSAQTITKNDLVQVGSDSWYRVLRVNRKTVSLDADSWPRTVGWDRITGRRRAGQQLDTPTGQPWPTELADRVARWNRLAHLATLAPHDEDSRRRARHTAWAQRLVHGLDLDAAAAELAAVQATPRTVDALRYLASRYLDIHHRLQAGEPAHDIATTITPDPGQPAWRIPTDRQPEDRRAGPTGYHTDRAPLVAPGDLVRGFYDAGTARALIRSFCGPVAAVSGVRHRREAGDWVTITLADRTAHEFATHVWFAVYPAGTWPHTPAPAHPAT